jgi:CheY-like chemotaxis protein
MSTSNMINMSDVSDVSEAGSTNAAGNYSDVSTDTVPATSSTAAAPPKISRMTLSMPDGHETPKTILFAEDMNLFSEPITLALQARGYRVICVRDGHEAINVAQYDAPDLILLDLGLPQMDGLSFLRHLRNRRLHHERPIIVLTASATREFVMAARELQVQDYLLKSQCTVKMLLDRIATRLQPKVADAAPAAASASAAEHPIA